MLSHEGVIEARPNRGFRVARMARQDVEDIYWVHGVLAGRLTAKACERLSSADLLELEENTHKLTEAMEANAVDVVEKLNWQFHRLINAAADSPKIHALLKITVKQIPARFYTVLPDWGRLSAHDHKELMDALRKRDAKEAEKLPLRMWAPPAPSWSTISSPKGTGTIRSADQHDLHNERQFPSPGCERPANLAHSVRVQTCKKRAIKDLARSNARSN